MKDTIGTTEKVLYMEVSLIQRLNNTAMYYCGIETGVLNREVSFIQRVPNREVPLYVDAKCVESQVNTNIHCSIATRSLSL